MKAPRIGLVVWPIMLVWNISGSNLASVLVYTGTKVYVFHCRLYSTVHGVEVEDQSGLYAVFFFYTLSRYDIIWVLIFAKTNFKSGNNWFQTRQTSGYYTMDMTAITQKGLELGAIYSACQCLPHEPRKA